MCVSTIAAKSDVKNAKRSEKENKEEAKKNIFSVSKNRIAHTRANIHIHREQKRRTNTDEQQISFAFFF